MADELAGGGLTYIPGSAAEPTPLLDLWAADPGLTRDARILTSLVPGINGMAMDALHPSATVTGLFMQPAWQAAQAAGRFRHLPLSYSGFVRHVRERVAADACVVHVSPPDRAGRWSLGPAVEFTPLVQARSRRTLALVNPLMPAMPGRRRWIMRGSTGWWRWSSRRAATRWGRRPGRPRPSPGSSAMAAPCRSGWARCRMR